MKRVSSNSDIPLPPYFGAMPGTAINNPNVRQGVQADVQRTGHYLPSDVLERTLLLASDAERKRGAPIVKLRTSSVNGTNYEPGAFFNLPEDMLRLIAFKLERKSAHALASTCVGGYRCADLVSSTRRLPGLLRDLKRLRTGNLKILPASVAAFLQAISPGGNYDRLLLTPLSTADRCAASLAIAVWAAPKLQTEGEKEVNATNKLFFEKNYDVNFEYGLETIFDLQAGINKPIPKYGTDSWKDVFRGPNIISKELKEIIFTKLAHRSLRDPHSFSVLVKIAAEYTAGIDVYAMALEALIYRKNAPLSLAGLAEMPLAGRPTAIKRMIDAAQDRSASDGVDPDLYAMALISLLRTLTEPSETDRHVISKMADGLNHLLCRLYKPTPVNYLAFDELLFSGPEINGASVGLFARLLIDKIAECQAYLPARKLLNDIVSEIHSSNGACPLTEAYIREKLN